jgi:hypothetical protein
MDRRILAVLCLAALSGCGGGGGSSAAPGGGSAPTPKTVSGDMLALAPSRGWNYQTTFNGTSLSVSLYDDPTTTNGVSALWAVGATGLVPTVLTSATAATNSRIAALAITQGSAGYSAIGENSFGGLSALPRSPLFVGSTLTQGTTTTPYAGLTETVVAVGAVANANICPTPTDGATVAYTYSGSTYTSRSSPAAG